MGILVCSACGEPSCWEGEFFCEDYRRASTVTCSCEYVDNRRTAIDPACMAHGGEDE